ncbi:hypothetical protein FOA43_000988 [Brettanomyces nanus]|uniref:mRNA cap guanine-N(7) methyltransferase n=1 Tax=Eeniella nana TaxID=13502 RepID=A0A875S036_EENNA|nr:uncharacterized protein FOA43_000988 [Brettanomyces nanus]QPG73675.1 hypothetical protein FOA43_000988 [Brettanomyces nanus]
MEKTKETIKEGPVEVEVGAAEADKLIMAKRRDEEKRLTEEDEEDNEPIDASAPNSAGRSTEKADKGNSRGINLLSGVSTQKRRIKQSRGTRENGLFFSRDRGDGLNKDHRDGENSLKKELSAVLATTTSLPRKPAWMPEEQYKKQLESIEVYTAPEQELKRIKVEDKKSLGRRSAVPSHPISKKEHDVIVRNFYNDQTYRSRRQKRTESKIYKLRSFNNCIKYILISKYATRGGNVLDLGCGKGGDLAKWGLTQISSYVGIDISDQSIKEAIHRYRKSRCQFHAIFATGDAFNTQVPEIVAPFKNEVNLQFDTVSMQFCLHYAFANEETARRMLENVSRSLKLGGMFIGTIPSSDFIRWKIKRLHSGSKKWGNSLYEVEFPEPPPRDGQFPSPFGNMYTYYLVDAVDHVPEYVVPFEKLRSLCEEYNLELRYKKNLFELFNKEIPKYFHLLPPPLVESLKRSDGTYGVSGEDRDACSFYLAFAFEKTS